MVKMVVLMALVPTVASADSWRLGTERWEHHGCASPRAASVLADFVSREPTFVFNGKAALIVEARPVDKDGKVVPKGSKDAVGVKESSWRADVILETSGKAHWTMPRNPDTQQQVNIIVDVSPFQQSPDGVQNIGVDLVVDYDPHGTGTHENVCAEHWFGAAVRL